MAASTGSTAIAGDGTTGSIKTTTGVRAVGGTGINIKIAGDSATSTATSTGSTAMAGDGITGGFMVRKAASTITARPATIETTISSSNRNGKANSQVRDFDQSDDNCAIVMLLPSHRILNKAASVPTCAYETPPRCRTSTCSLVFVV